VRRVLLLFHPKWRLHTRKEVSCGLPLSNQLTAWKHPCWFYVTPEACTGLWIRVGCPLRIDPWCEVVPLTLVAVATEDEIRMWTKGTRLHYGVSLSVAGVTSMLAICGSVLLLLQASCVMWRNVFSCMQIFAAPKNQFCVIPNVFNLLQIRPTEGQFICRGHISLNVWFISGQAKVLTVGRRLARSAIRRRPVR